MNEQIFDMLTVFGTKLIVALLILIVGVWIAKLIRRGFLAILKKRELDPMVTTFLTNLVYYTLLIFVVIAALNQLGVQTTSLIAVFGAAGLAIGLALQGSLANFAAGFLILIFRPYRVGDYIEGAGVSGSIEKLQVFNTILNTPDNKVVIIPNANMLSGNIINYSQKETRRVDLVVGIGYEDDIPKAKKLLQDIVTNHKLVLKDPTPVVAVSELADSSVNIVVRPWVKTADYWTVHFELTESIKHEFDANGISIPYPQRDVHMYEHKAN
jgi:small conductance mechanosensitive channel